MNRLTSVAPSWAREGAKAARHEHPAPLVVTESVNAHRTVAHPTAFEPRELCAVVRPVERLDVTRPLLHVIDCWGGEGVFFFAILCAPVCPSAESRHLSTPRAGTKVDTRAFGRGRSSRSCPVRCDSPEGLRPRGSMRAERRRRRPMRRARRSRLRPSHSDLDASQLATAYPLERRAHVCTDTAP